MTQNRVSECNGDFSTAIGSVGLFIQTCGSESTAPLRPFRILDGNSQIIFWAVVPISKQFTKRWRQSVPSAMCLQAPQPILGSFRDLAMLLRCSEASFVGRWFDRWRSSMSTISRGLPHRSASSSGISIPSASSRAIRASTKSRLSIARGFISGFYPANCR